MFELRILVYVFAAMIYYVSKDLVKIYEIVLSLNPSTTALVSSQSNNLVELTHFFTKMYEYRRRQAHAHST